MHHRSLTPVLLVTGLVLASVASAATPSAAGAASPAMAGPVVASAGGALAAGAPGQSIVVTSLGGQPGDSGRRPALRLGGRTYVLPAHPRAASGPRARVRPRYRMYTLTVDATNLSGKPDTGDTVTITDADDPGRLPPPDNSEPFYHGVAKFSVPAGHLWLFGRFADIRGNRYVATYFDVPPEITVTGNMTVRLAARAATSKIQFVTARPTTVDTEVFELNYLTGNFPHGSFASYGFYTIPVGGAPAPAIYVSPLTASRGVGRLIQVTSAVLGSPAAAPGVPYQYDLAYQSPPDTIQPQRFVVSQARLATENASFYSADVSHGALLNFPGFPVERQTSTFAVSQPATLPLRQTIYMTANPALTWTTQYIQAMRAPNFLPDGGQGAPPQVFLPGQRLTDDWGAYPLHPAMGVKLQQIRFTYPAQASASRAGDTLGLAMTMFSDNTPGHDGGPVFPPLKITGSYQIDQNGTKIASGTTPSDGSFQTTARLRPERSLIRVAITDTEPAKLNPLSTTNSTVWTWWSAHETGAKLPPNWICADAVNRSCAVEPLLTLRYGVIGENLSGATGPGQQVVRLSIGHLQLAHASKITSVAMSVSFDGGKTWHKARITGAGGSYAAVFNAPAGAVVTMRTAATDASGDSITQTITDAYKVAA